MKKLKMIVLMICLTLSCVLITGCGCEKEKFIVTFNSNGGSYVESQTVEKNGTASAPIEPIRDGYIFIEWLLDDVKYDFTTKVTKDITLKANWGLSNLKTYTVTFNSNGGSNVASVKVSEGNTIFSLPTPTRNGYAFVGWYLGNTEYNSSTKINKDITLVAKWEEVKENEYTVTFDSNNGSWVKNQKVEEGNKVAKPNNPTRTGYTFVKWQLDGEDFDFNTKITKNITLVALWKKKTQYTVSFNTNGGNQVSSVKVYEGNKVTKPTDPTRDGYTFVKWQLDGKDYDFSSKVTSDITLKAIWKEVVITYKIEEIEDSQVGQVRVFVIRNEEIVDGVVDITTINGKVKKVEISKDGYITNGAIIESIDNVKVK